MNRNHTVSAVIPTRNRPQLVARAVKSALEQNYDDLEVVVVIDGPDAATEEVLSQIEDKRLRIIALPESVGAARGRNLGVEAAWGDWIALLDDDDEWLPEKTAAQMRVACSSQYRYPVVSSRLFAKTSKYALVWPRKLPTQPISEYLLTREGWSYGEGLLSTITLLFPKDLYEQVPFRAELTRHQDLDWVLRVSEFAGVGIEFVPEPLAIWHQAENRKSISVTSNWKASMQWLESVKSLITRRAYSGFIASHIAAQAAREGAWATLPYLLRKMFDFGRPKFHDVALFVGMWCVPRGLRLHVRQEGR
jgi:glycosyltransferase involved in cell wall biosynthesis